MRTGVIGVGSMGRNHARVLSETSELIGIADTNEAAGKEVSHRLHTRHFAEARELLGKVEAVTIATPTAYHYDVAKQALEAGVHALIEKPFCGDSGKAQQLVDLAKSQGLVLAAGMVERHNPAVSFARNSLEEGQYGDLITTSARRVSSFPSRVADVGVILDLAIHDIDVMSHLIGSPVVSVYSLARGSRKPEQEDHANILLSFQNGVHGFLEANWLTPMKVRKLALTCSKCFVELDYTEQSLSISSSTLVKFDPYNLYQLPFDVDVRKVTLQRQEPLAREITDFLRAITEKGEPLAGGEEAVSDLLVAEAAARSLQEGKAVFLD